MPRTPKEATEEIERVMLPCVSTLFMLLDTLMAVLVVDLAGFRLRQDIVGFGYRDKLFMRRVIAASINLSALWVKCFSERTKRGIALGRNFMDLLTGSYQGGISC